MSYMKVKNIKSGLIFDTTKQDYERLIVAQGVEHKYEIVDDGSPFEVKRLREKKEEEKIEIKNKGKKGEVIVAEIPESKPSDKKK